MASMGIAMCVAGWSLSANRLPAGYLDANPGHTLDRTPDPARRLPSEPMPIFEAPIAEFRPSADTLLADSIRAGQVLIRRLPDRLQGRPVDTYEPVILPATGWLQDRSFFWRVPGDLAGAYRFVFAARRRGSAPDTVIVQVQVSPQ